MCHSFFVLHLYCKSIKKKQVHASEQKREDVAQARKEWKEKQENHVELPVDKLVFLDESGVNIDMVRRYGRAKNKNRVNDYAPVNTPKKTTLVSSVRLDGTQAYEFFQGSLNGKNFLSYVKNTLIPTLKKGDIVVMDNLSCHKVKGVKEAIEEAGASVLYLPPYSPDFNPIEMMWSKMKTLLRNWKTDTPELLHSVIPDAFSSVSVSDISGWFTASGYCSS